MQRVKVELELDLPFVATKEDIEEWIMLEVGIGGSTHANPLVAADIDLEGGVVSGVSVEAW